MGVGGVEFIVIGKCTTLRTSRAPDSVSGPRCVAAITLPIPPVMAVSIDPVVAVGRKPFPVFVKLKSANKSPASDAALVVDFEIQIQFAQIG
jgi:hypothetical protein